jgi:hypothetical protein
MLGILIVIGLCAIAFRQYTEVAFEFHRPRVGFGFAGVGFFLAGFFLVQVVEAVLIALLAPDMLNDTAALLIAEILAYILAILIALWVLRIFKRSWARARDNGEMLDK